MKHVIYLPAVLLAQAILASCGTVKRSSYHKETVQDSASVHSHVQTKDRNEHTRETVVRDTAIGIKARSVEGAVRAEDAAPVRNAAGAARPQRYEQHSEGLTAWIAIDTNGSLRYGCKADSLTIVVQGLIREKESWRRQYEQLSETASRQYQQQASETRQAHIQTRYPLWLYLLAGGGLCAALLTAAYRIYKMLHR